MNDEIVFDEDYFYREVGFWYSTSNRLRGFRGSFDRLPDLPELSENVSEQLEMLIPALNKAKQDMAHNMSLGCAATEAFGAGLTEVGRNYGMTEQEAEELSRRVG